MRVLSNIVTLLGVGLVGITQAQQPNEISAKEALAQAQADLKKSTIELNAQRKEIAEEKLEVSADWNKIERDLLTKRRQARLARMGQADRDAMVKELESQSKRSQNELMTMSQRAGNFASRFTVELFQGEQQYAEVAENARTSQGNAQLLNRLKVLEAGIDRLENALGGGLYEVDAVDADGVVRSGKLATVGPALWFVSGDGSAAGVAKLDKATGTLKLSDSNTENADVAEQAKAIVGGQQIEAILDITGGKATALKQIDSSWGELFQKGGVWVYPIVGIALISILCAIMKLLQFLGIKTPKAGYVRGILDALDSGEQGKAAGLASSVKHPIAHVFGSALPYANRGADIVEEVLYEQLIGVEEKLQKWLQFIAITAATAPLLGLLGTVTGMITTFNIITVAGTGDAKPLAGGISEALVTTMFGLVVAIPALILHALLSRRAKGITQTTERLGLSLVNGIRAKSADPATQNN